MNKTINSAVKVEIEERISQKTNKPYYVLLVTFANGYTFEAYLNNEQKYIIELNN